jgi:hypothetical protein
MEHVDLLYSGLIVTALMLSLWAALLVTAACIFFAPSLSAHVHASSNLKSPLPAPPSRTSPSLVAHSS